LQGINLKRNYGVKGDEKNVLIELASPFLPFIARQLRNREAEKRAETIHSLAILGFSDYIHEIISALDDPSPLVAMVAARSMANKQNSQYAGVILSRLHRFENWNRPFLVSMLTSMGAEILPELKKFFADNKQSATVRIIIAETLKEINDFTSADIAVRIMQKETDRELIAACLRLLSNIGTPEHLPVIRKLFDSPDFIIRAYVIQILGRIGGHEDVELLKNALLDESSTWVAIRAAGALADLNEFDTLREISESDHSQAHLAKQILMEERYKNKSRKI